MKQLTFTAIIIGLFVNISLGQAIQNQKQSKINTVSENDTAYYASVRYVIVYDWTLDEREERRVEILMGEKQFNEKNLRQIFELIKERFPSPIKLEIEVHTNLATIETPEEREMWEDSDDSRFSSTHFKYKKASYSRFDNGRESFIYTISLLPYRDKTVVLKDVKF